MVDGEGGGSKLRVQLLEQSASDSKSETVTPSRMSLSQEGYLIWH